METAEVAERPSEEPAAAEPAEEPAEEQPLAGGDAEDMEPEDSRDPDGDARLACPAELPQGMACVRGGTFLRGDEEDESASSPAEVFVSSFLMDTHETTWAEYNECVAARRCERPIRYRRFMGPRQPAIAMRFEDAVAYCEMRGKRLPTEAEWERAARGEQNTAYPWGDAPATCDRANVRDARGHGCGTEITSNVGSYPAGHFGLYDMAGNVDEWTADWWAPCYRGCERECGQECEGDNPRGPCGGASECPGRVLRVVRGGSWWWDGGHARATFRRGKPPRNRANHRYGIRCARDVAL